jgi:hypothetical protein
MRRSYVVPMRWMVIYEYEVPGGALNLKSTNLPRPWSPRGSSPSRKNPHGSTGNRTRDLMISSQKLWTLDHEAGRSVSIQCSQYKIGAHSTRINTVLLIEGLISTANTPIERSLLSTPTLTVSGDGRQRSGRCCSTLPWAWVQAASSIYCSQYYISTRHI